jgi:hypothetical protein
MLDGKTGKPRTIVEIVKAARLRTVETGNAPRFCNLTCAESPYGPETDTGLDEIASRASLSEGSGASSVSFLPTWRGAHWSPFLSRAVAMTTAVLCTWLIHRHCDQVCAVDNECASAHVGRYHGRDMDRQA